MNQHFKLVVFQQDEKTKPHPLHHRKLPEVPPKRLTVSPPPSITTTTVRSKSSGDVLEGFMLPVENSLPLELMRSPKMDSDKRPMITPSRIRHSLSTSATQLKTNDDSHVEQSLPVNALNHISNGTIEVTNTIGVTTSSNDDSIDIKDDIKPPEIEIKRFRSETFTKEVHSIIVPPTQEERSTVENLSINDSGITSILPTGSSEQLNVLTSGTANITLNNDDNNIEDDNDDKSNSLSRLNPASLTHYNRLSLKKRGSYIKAVTASQKKHGEAATDNQISSEEIEEEHQSIMTALSERKEVNIMRLK